MSRRSMPRVGDALLQVALWVGAYYAYRLVRGLTGGETALAFEHARGVVQFERSAGIFFEPGLQHWVLTHLPWLIDITSWCYVNLHLLGTAIFMVWLYTKRRESFPFVRNMFMMAMALGLIGFLLYPTAPPRYLPEWGFTDTVSDFVGTHVANHASVLYNPYAAIPSLHVAFALLIGVPGARLTRTRWLRPLWYFYPVFVFFTVLVTANHFWLDAVLGSSVALMSFYAASYALARARPEVWAWRTPVEAEATI